MKPLPPVAPRTGSTLTNPATTPGPRDRSLSPLVTWYLLWEKGGDRMRTLVLAPAIAGRERILLQKVKHVVTRIVPGARVMLYGSAARGEQHPDSDFDLLILTEAPLGEEDNRALQDSLYELELAHGVVLSTVQYTTQEWDSPLNEAMPFHQRVAEDAVLL